MLELVTSEVEQQLAEEGELRFYRYEESTDGDSEGTCNTWKCLADQSSCRYRQQKADMERRHMIEEVSSAFEQPENLRVFVIVLAAV